MLTKNGVAVFALLAFIGCSGTGSGTSTLGGPIPNVGSPSVAAPAVPGAPVAASEPTTPVATTEPQLAQAQTVAGSVYYVAPTGDDRAAGSAAAPFATIEHAADIVVAGDSVIVKDGAYTDCGNCVGVNYNVLFKHSGTPAARITFRAENSHGPVVDGGGVRRCMGVNDNVAWITIQGFHLQNCLSGITGFANAHDIVMKDNVIERIGQRGNCGTNGGGGFAGIAWGEAWNLVVDSNTIHDVGEMHNQYRCSYTNDHGIYAHGHDITIVNNVFYNNNSGWDIQVTGGPSGQHWLIANNTFGARNDPRAPGNIVIWTGPGPNTPADVTIENNISGLSLATAFVNCIYGPNTANLVVRNNLVQSNVALLTGGCTATAANNMLDTDPRFVDPAAFNFHLQVGSPALGAALPLPLVRDGRDGTPRTNAPAIGAY